MAANTLSLDGITAFLDLNKCSDYITFAIEGNPGRVRVVGTCEDPWFCGKDVCEILGYSNKKLALQQHVNSKCKRSLSEFSRNGVVCEMRPTLLGQNNLTTDHNQGRTVYINEPGLYALIMKSKTPFAGAFQDLVCSYILPTLRKHGNVNIEEIRKQFELELEKKDQEIQETIRRKDQEIQEANERALNFQTLAISNCNLEQTQVIYIATSANYARQNRFKVGGVLSEKHLRSRLATYNGRSAEGDMFYYSNGWMVVDYRQIEERLKCLLGRFRDKKRKEMYVMSYPHISYIVNYLVEHLSDEVEEVNAKMNEFIENYPLKKGAEITIPQAWIFNEVDCNLEEDAVENVIVTIEHGLENLRETLTTFLRTLPSTQKEITKKEVFDHLNVKNRNEKLDVLKEVIKDVRPDIVLKARRTQPWRTVKDAVKYEN
jgi:prophage antirepressor-like protein